jgi:hypothetical protein
VVALTVMLQFPKELVCKTNNETILDLKILRHDRLLLDLGVGYSLPPLN